MTKIAAVVVLLCALGAVHAEARVGTLTSWPVIVVRSAAWVAQPAAMMANRFSAGALVTLPPEDKPKTHWPWWLRILAVIGVLVFIRLVAGSVRNKPTGPPQP
jgi:hypothetical protein